MYDAMWGVHQIKVTHDVHIQALTVLTEVSIPCAGLLRFMCKCVMTSLFFFCFSFFQEVHNNGA